MLHEAAAKNIAVLGIQEARRPGRTVSTAAGLRVFYSGSTQGGQQGVARLLSCCKYRCRLYDNRSQPETTSHCIYRVAVGLEPLKVYSPSPTKTSPISARLLPHTARGNVPPFSCRALFRNKSGTIDLDTVPNTEESKRQGRLTRGRACRKLEGAGSSPKNASIALDRAFPSRTNIAL